jgi:hypothetical protein
MALSNSWIAPADRRFALPAKLPDPARALSIPCRHCVGERDLRRLNCWRHA